VDDGGCARTREAGGGGGEPGAAAVVRVYAEALRELTQLQAAVISPSSPSSRGRRRQGVGIEDAVAARARVAEVPPDQMLPSL
jgi:pre-mRNA cleavage complex 2 protein Pcf11